MIGEVRKQVTEVFDYSAPLSARHVLACQCGLSFNHLHPLPHSCRAGPDHRNSTPTLALLPRAVAVWPATGDCAQIWHRLTRAAHHHQWAMQYTVRMLAGFLTREVGAMIREQDSVSQRLRQRDIDYSPTVKELLDRYPEQWVVIFEQVVDTAPRWSRRWCGLRSEGVTARSGTSAWMRGYTSPRRRRPFADPAQP